MRQLTSVLAAALGGVAHPAVGPSPPNTAAQLAPDALARRFEPWRQRHSQLSRELRDQPHLLTPPSPPSSIM